MATSIPDLTAQSGTFNTTGPVVDLDGAAVSGNRTFATAASDGDLTDGDTTYVLVKKDASNQLVWKCTWNDLATDTVARTTELLSIGTISNTDSVEVSVGNPSELIERAYLVSRGHLEGLDLDYNAGTLKVLEGKAVVDGVLLEIGSAGSTTISGDALSGNAIYYIYLYDNAGTTQLHRESRGSGTDDPVWDTDLNYAKHPGDGASKRCIGAVSVGSISAGALDEFYYSSRGRDRHYYCAKQIARVVSAGSATTATSVDCSASIPAVSICRDTGIKLHIKNTSVGSTIVVYIMFAQTAAGCSNFGGLQVSAEMDTASTAAALGPMSTPVDSTTFYYLVNNANADGFVDVISWGLYV